MLVVSYTTLRGGSANEYADSLRHRNRTELALGLLHFALPSLGLDDLVVAAQRLSGAVLAQREI
jgi:hypothetical protein